LDAIPTFLLDMTINISVVVVVVEVFENAFCGYHFYPFPNSAYYSHFYKCIGDPFASIHLISLSSCPCSLGIVSTHKPHPSILA